MSTALLQAQDVQGDTGSQSQDEESASLEDRVTSFLSPRSTRLNLKRLVTRAFDGECGWDGAFEFATGTPIPSPLSTEASPAEANRPSQKLERMNSIIECMKPAAAEEGTAQMQGTKSNSLL